MSTLYAILLLFVALGAAGGGMWLMYQIDRLDLSKPLAGQDRTA